MWTVASSAFAAPDVRRPQRQRGSIGSDHVPLLYFIFPQQSVVCAMNAVIEHVEAMRTLLAWGPRRA